MIKKLFLLSVLALGSSAWAEESNPEIEKIDARLDELRTIWRQEQAIINGYTKNRTVPVREGSAQYHACLKASQRIQQAEAEAKQLKEKRKALAEGGTVAEVGNGPASNENFAVVTKKIPPVEYDRSKHGPKVKGRRIQAANAIGRAGRGPGAVGGFWFNDQAEQECRPAAA